MPYDRREALLTSIASNVRRFREERGLTQADLAEAAGLEVLAVQRVERGRTNFGVVTFAALADALQVSTADLITLAPYVPRTPGRPRKPR